MEWPIFAGLPQEDVQAVLAVARRRTFSKGEVVFHHGDPGDSLHHRSATIAALESAETRALAHSEFEQLRTRHHGIDRVLVALLAAEVRHGDELLLDALYVPAERRVLRRLLELGSPIVLTQEELAHIAGTSRATMNRVLRDEEKRGTLALDRGRTTITDVETLRRRARVAAER